MPDNHAKSDDLFQAVTREATLASRVTTQLEQLIVENRLQPGDRLPSERDLAQQFGVSRTVIREAVRALVAKGLLQVQSGSGTTVRSPTTQSISQSLTLLLRRGQSSLEYEKVHEVRRLLEVEIAGRAAERRTDDDLTKIEEILHEMAVHQDNIDELARKDVAFHTALAHATHNELFVVLLDSVVDIMIQVRQLGIAVPGSREYALEAHRQIFEQVKAGNMDGARQEMADHLAQSEIIFRRALAMRRET